MVICSSFGAVNWFVSALITGVIAFAATNLDDILFLTVFFSQSARKWQVVVGQYLAFTALILVSPIGLHLMICVIPNFKFRCLWAE